MATIYLSPSGSDSNTYAQAQSPSTPWATFAKVESSATAGDTVEVGAGTYAWDDITWTKGFTFNGPAISPGTGLAPTAIVDAGSARKRWVAISLAMVFNRLLFKDNVNTTTASFSCFLIGGTATATWNNCVFRDITIFGSANPAAQGLIIITSNDVVITLTGCIVDKIFRGAAGAYCQIFNQSTSLTLPIWDVTNCTIYHAGTGATAISHIGGGNAGSSNGTWRNVIIHSPNANIAWWGTTTFAGTLTYSNTNGVTSPPSGTGNISTDPLFADAPNGDFRLRPASPCIGAGVLV